ncbi:MAG: hypothetical protein IKZ90_08435 [Clostridiales bacterium]|nr:hypothetical protein [Clostridiales bacterium]
MTTITEYKGKYIKAVITVIVITVVCLIFFFLIKNELVRCYLKPTYKEADWTGIQLEPKIEDEIGVAIENATPTPVPEDRVEWGGEKA